MRRITDLDLDWHLCDVGVVLCPNDGTLHHQLLVSQLHPIQTLDRLTSRYVLDEVISTNIIWQTNLELIYYKQA